MSLVVCPCFGVAWTLLAESSDGSAAVKDLLFYTGLLVAIVLGAAVTLGFLRRKLLDTGHESLSASWTLADLRELRARGQITQEEFDRMKSAVISDVRRHTAGAQSAQLVEHGSLDETVKD